MIESYPLPEGWRWVRLGEVIEIPESGSRPKGGVFEIKEGIPSIGAEHLNSLGGFNLSSLRFIPREFYLEMKRGKIQKGDVLVVKDGATTGKVAYVGDDFPYAHSALNEHVFRLRATEGLRQEFLFWFLYSPLGQEQVQQEFHGAAQGGINQQFVSGVYIPRPPLPEQKRIVAKLQELMQEVERASRACEKQLEAAQSLPAAYLREVFESEEAEKWEKKRLGEVCEINPSRPKDFIRYSDAPTTFIPMAAVDERTGTVSTPQIVPYSKVSKGYTYFEENDVLFAKITPCMQNGKHVIAKNLIDGIGFGTTEFHVLQSRDEILPEWIYYFIRQPYFLQEATAFFTGAVGQQRIPESFLSNYVIPLPPIDEQRRLATKIQDFMQEVGRARTACERQIEALNALPQMILSKAFRGDL